MLRKVLLENVVKNVILVGLLVASYQPVRESILATGITNDNGFVGDLLVVVSIIAVVACFGNFAFTYETVNAKSTPQRMLAHLTTALLMLVIGLSLQLTLVFTELILPSIPVFATSLALLYVASVLYDFWDLLRNVKA